VPEAAAGVRYRGDPGPADGMRDDREALVAVHGPELDDAPHPDRRGGGADPEDRPRALAEGERPDQADVESELVEALENPDAGLLPARAPARGQADPRSPTWILSDAASTRRSGDCAFRIWLRLGILRN
jgi:hypothetical protein